MGDRVGTLVATADGRYTIQRGLRPQGSGLLGGDSVLEVAGHSHGTFANDSPGLGVVVVGRQAVQPRQIVC
jgi:hypothetical protein